jgi:hypothetical protein
MPLQAHRNTMHEQHMFPWSMLLFHSLTCAVLCCAALCCSVQVTSGSPTNLLPRWLLFHLMQTRPTMTLTNTHPPTVLSQPRPTVLMLTHPTMPLMLTHPMHVDRMTAHMHTKVGFVSHICEQHQLCIPGHSAALFIRANVLETSGACGMEATSSSGCIAFCRLCRARGQTGPTRYVRCLTALFFTVTC